MHELYRSYQSTNQNLMSPAYAASLGQAYETTKKAHTRQIKLQAAYNEIEGYWICTAVSSSGHLYHHLEHAV